MGKWMQSLIKAKNLRGQERGIEDKDFSRQRENERVYAQRVGRGKEGESERAKQR